MSAKRFNIKTITKLIPTTEAVEQIFGKLPTAPELESAVLHSVVIAENNRALSELIKSEYFTVPEFKIYADAILELNKDRRKIDYITVLEVIKKNNQNFDFSKFVAFTSNNFLNDTFESFKYKVEILKNYSVKRNFITKSCEAIVQIQNPSVEPFELIRNYATEIRSDAHSTALRVRDMTENMRDALDSEENIMLSGPLIRFNEVVFLFAEPGTGKTILSYQIADAISKGVDTIPKILEIKHSDECRIF